MLYDSKPLIEIDFDSLKQRMEDRLRFQSNNNRNLINGFDYDDIYQELLICLWKTLSKLPADIDKFDYRFLRYMDRCFYNHLRMVRRTKCRFTSGTYALRDSLDYKADIDIDNLPPR